VICLGKIIVQGCKLPFSCDALSSLPQTIGSITHIKSILHYTDSFSVRGENNNEKFRSLISSRDGDFMDSSGMLWLCFVSIMCGSHVFYDIITILTKSG